MGELVLLRHGKTFGNTLGRYIGCKTDEPLCEEGILELEALWGCLAKGASRLLEVKSVYISPMKRCAQTAKILWPEIEPVPVLGLRECDFGDFENRSYQELSGNPDYQAWIDSKGTLPFPRGEAQEQFKERCCRAFAQIVSETAERKDPAALVVHGGTIMAVLERYGAPKQGYFDYQVKNGHGFFLTPVEGTRLWNYRLLP